MWLVSFEIIPLHVFLHTRIYMYSVPGYSYFSSIYHTFVTDTDVMGLLTECLMEIRKNQAEMLRWLCEQQQPQPTVLPFVLPAEGGDGPGSSGLQHFLAPVRALSVCTDDEIDFLWETSSSLASRPATPRSLASGSPHHISVLSSTPPTPMSPPPNMASRLLHHQP